jgi:hypothetical protein
MARHAASIRRARPSCGRTGIEVPGHARLRLVSQPDAI